jgi:prepilin-type N-terminal cleavage/methylation domain-containing protein
MKLSNPPSSRGFTLLETVIAIGVLAVLLTGFLVVFTPAADGIRKSISSQQADRLTTTLERELVTLREADQSISSGSSDPTGFDKAFDWIKESGSSPDNALFVYQYRGSSSQNRSDGTPEPQATTKDKITGKDFTVVSMARRKNDSSFIKDLAAIEGSVYLVKCKQLVFDKSTGELKPGKPGEITDPTSLGNASQSADDYSEAIIAFSAEFYIMPSKDENFYSGSVFDKRFENFKASIFTRNLVVRR